MSDKVTTKQRLLASAVELMAMHGSIEAVSLRAVAGAAGVSPTAVYRHFADRDALIVDALEWAWMEFDRALNEASAGTSDPHERLHRQGHAYVDVALERTGVYTVLFGHKDAAAGTQTDVGLEVFDNMVNLVGDVLEVNADERPRFDVATQLFTAIHGIAHLRSVLPTFPWPSLDQQVDGLLQQLRLGRGARKPE